MGKLSQLRNKLTGYLNTQSKPAKAPIERVQSAAPEPEPLEKEKEYVHIEARHGMLIPSSSRPTDAASHVVLKFGFCCEPSYNKLVAKNHVAQLYDCHKGKCASYPKYLVKVPMEVLN